MVFFWSERLDPTRERYGVHWAITDRTGGSSQAPFDQFNLAGHVGDGDTLVAANRDKLARELGCSRPTLRFMDQQHGCDVAVTRDAGQGGASAVDALISDNPHEALVVLVADCVPLLLIDRIVGLVAAVHAGRPGMVLGVVPATLARMRELGGVVIEAVVGPSVCPRCYEVPAAMRDEAVAVEPAAAGLARTGTPAIDVAAGVTAQLTRAGVAMRRLPGCTRESPDLYSYRRDGRTGRFAGVVRLLPREQPA